VCEGLPVKPATEVPTVVPDSTASSAWNVMVWDVASPRRVAIVRPNLNMLLVCPLRYSDPISCLIASTIYRVRNLYDQSPRALTRTPVPRLDTLAIRH
jgi:hypothetical protein